MPVSEGSDALISFTDMGRQRGFTVTSRVLRCATREATLAEAEELGDRARAARCATWPGSAASTALPIAATEAIVPDYLAPGLAGTTSPHRSLYDVLRDRVPGVAEPAASSRSRPRRRHRRSAEHLEISRGEPVLIFSQTGYDQLGRAFELARTVYRADRYLFRGTLVADSEGTAPVVRETR